MFEVGEGGGEGGGVDYHCWEKVERESEEKEIDLAEDIEIATNDLEIKEWNAKDLINRSRTTQPHLIE